MSIVSYNGITLDYIKTLGFDQEPVFTADGVEYLYTHFRIAVESVINAGIPSESFNETTAAQVISRMRARLMKPRGPLVFIVNGDVLLESPVRVDKTGKVPLIDAHNGPHPIHCNIVHINGSQTFIVNFIVETWLVECYSDLPGEPGYFHAKDVPAYIANRWRESISIDEHFYTKRIRSGKLYLRTDKLVDDQGNIFADQTIFRTLVNPPLLSGYKRIRSEYMIDEDHSALAYVIEDQELYKMPPVGMTKMDGNFITTTQLGAKFIKEGVIRLWGNLRTKKADMIAAAVVIIKNRMTGFGRAPQKSLLQFASVMDSITENMIEVRMRYWIGGPAASVYGFTPDSWFNSFDNIFAEAGDPRDPPQLSSRGTSMLALVAPSLNDPCLTGLVRQLTTFLLPDDVPVEGSSGEISVLKTGVVSTISTLNNQNETQSGIYTDYQLETTYESNIHRVQLPIMQEGNTLSSIPTLAAPTVRMRVKFRAERIDAPPTLPAPDVNNTNQVLIHHTLMPWAPEPAADGISVKYRIEGEYLYAIRDTNGFTYSMSTLPYTNILYTSTGLGFFTHGIIDPGTVTGELHTTDEDQLTGGNDTTALVAQINAAGDIIN